MSTSNHTIKNAANIPLNADRLRQARHACQYSLEEVAQRAHLNKMTLLRYESGDIRTISPQRLYVLAHIYQTTVAYLCGTHSHTHYHTDDGLHIVPISADPASHLGHRLLSYLHLMENK